MLPPSQMVFFPLGICFFEGEWGVIYLWGKLSLFSFSKAMAFQKYQKSNLINSGQSSIPAHKVVWWKAGIINYTAHSVVKLAWPNKRYHVKLVYQLLMTLHWLIVFLERLKTELRLYYDYSIVLLLWIFRFDRRFSNLNALDLGLNSFFLVFWNCLTCHSLTDFELQ